MPSKKPSVKLGLTRKEMDRIAAGVACGESPEVISKAIERTIEITVRGIMQLKTIQESPETSSLVKRTIEEDDPNGRADSAMKELHGSPTWIQLKSQYNTGELRYYEEQYCSIMGQFGDDITPTEKVQVHKAVQYEIIMNRNKVEQRKLMEAIEEEEGELRQMKKLHYDAKDPEKSMSPKVQLRIGMLVDGISNSKEELKGCLKTHTELDAKHQSLLEDLKATRNQRLDRTDKRVSFTDMIKAVLSEQNREAEGRRAELMRQAANRSRDELSQVHQYIDGTFDTPLINADNVGRLVIVHPAPEDSEKGEADAKEI